MGGDLLRCAHVTGTTLVQTVAPADLWAALGSVGGEMGSPLLLLLLALAGVAAGVINSIAGGGSFLTLPMLMWVGLAAPVANGTMRVAVLLQGLVVVGTFRRRGVRGEGMALRLAAPVLVGALVGSLAASRLEDALLRPVFGVALVGWAILLALRPGTFERNASVARPAGVVGLILAACIGVYGGFMQAGVGFPLLALLVSYLGMSPVQANLVKVQIVVSYTVVALAVFLQAGQVAWGPGLVLAAGTMLGGWLGTRWQVAAGAPLIRKFVMVAVFVAGAAMVAESITAPRRHTATDYPPGSMPARPSDSR